MNKNLTYVLSTYNKLPYLKVTIPILIDSLEEDEELIVIDGGSTDGTKEFIEKLYDAQKISFFISEKDKGEGHGFNKGLLLAKGELIKIISDDDVFNYPTIKASKKYLLEHPEIDAMGGNTASVDILNKNSLYWNVDFYEDFLNWKEGKLKRFFFNGTCLILRRSSLPIIGLVDTNIMLADMEYTLRMTGIINLAWCSGLISVRILNPQSNNLVFRKRADEDSERLCSYYNYKYPWERRNDELKNRSFFRKLRSFFSRKKKSFLNRKQRKVVYQAEPFSSFKEAHFYCINWMEKHPLNENIQFFQK